MLRNFQDMLQHHDAYSGYVSIFFLHLEMSSIVHDVNVNMLLSGGFIDEFLFKGILFLDVLGIITLIVE